MIKVLSLSACLCLLANAAFGQGTILWDESVNGPFANSSSSPTQLGTLQSGTNTVFGSVEVVPSGTTWLLFSDFLLLAVPGGHSLDGVWVSVSGTRMSAWIGDSVFAAQLVFVGNVSSGSLLEQWDVNQLGSGTYGLHIENHDFQATASVIDYRLDFVVIPEPSPLWLVLVGAGWLATVLQRRRSE